MLEIRIDSRNSNQRIDKLVRKVLPNASLSFIYRLFRKKDVKVNKHWVDINYILKEDETVQIYVTDLQLESFKKDENLCKTSIFSHKIIYEDENILIVNKPKNLLVHGDEKDKKHTLSNDVLNYLYQKGEYSPNAGFIPGPAHRIDRNTSGVVVFGKKIEVLQQLLNLFKEKDQITKTYLALVKGKVFDSGKIEAKLEKNEEKNMVFVSKSANAKTAITLFEPYKNFKDTTLLKVKILTGRTHQIRVHMSYIGHPIIGDKKYGDVDFNKKYNSLYEIDNQFLHAYSITFGQIDGILSYLSGREFVANLDQKQENILKKL
jgi:23S rRNA pseudouridine955/2504/2580 synthase